MSDRTRRALLNILIFSVAVAILSTPVIKNLGSISVNTTKEVVSESTSESTSLSDNFIESSSSSQEEYNKIMSMLLKICRTVMLLVLAMSIISFSVSFINDRTGGTAFNEFTSLIGDVDSYEESHYITIIQPVPIRGRYKYQPVHISTNSLSKQGQIEMLYVQKELDELYATAKSTKRSLSTYNTYSTYIETLIEELNKGIKECENPTMEAKFIARLDNVHTCIKTLKSHVDSDIQFEVDRQKYEDELKAEGYEPFSVLEQLNKLI